MCVCVCACVCMRVCMRACMRACVHVSVRAYVCPCVRACATPNHLYCGLLFSHTHTRAHARTHTHTHCVCYCTCIIHIISIFPCYFRVLIFILIMRNGLRGRRRDLPLNTDFWRTRNSPDYAWQPPLNSLLARAFDFFVMNVAISCLKNILHGSHFETGLLW